MITSYSIFSENLAPLNKLIAKMNKRALRLGLPEISLVVTGRETREENGYVWDVLNIEIGGQAPKLNGWEFVGTIQHAGEAGNILRIMPSWADVLPERFRTADPGNCDHCQKYRRRNDTYIVRSAELAYYQVGSNCLQDFVRSDKVGAMASMCEMMSMVHEAADKATNERGQGGQDSIYMDTLLAWTAEAMMRGGWISRGKARETGKEATVDRALRAVDGNRAGRRCDHRCLFPCPDHFTPTAGAVELAQKVLEWAPSWIESECSRQPDNDYLWNLRVVFATDLVTLRAAGIAASILTCYTRYMEKQAEIKRVRVASTSEYVGVVGEKIVLTLTLMAFKYIDNDFQGSTLHTFHDADGNVIKWFASGSHNPTVGETATYEMSVKDHTEFNGVKETRVLRVKPFVDAAEKKVRAKAKKEKKVAYEALQATADAAWTNIDNDDDGKNIYRHARDAANVAHKEWQAV